MIGGNPGEVIGSRVVRFADTSHVSIRGQALCGASVPADSVPVFDEPLCDFCFDNYLQWFMEASEFYGIARSELPAEYFEMLSSNVRRYGTHFRDGSDVATLFVHEGDPETRKNAMHPDWPNKWLRHIEMSVNLSSDTPIKRWLWQLLLERLAIPASA
jgi:hypothetical protein